MFNEWLQATGSQDESPIYDIHAHQLFAQLYAKATRHALSASILGRSTQLKPLDQALHNASVHSRYYAGVKLVALDAIHGSEGRSADFDALFRPRRRHMVHRWTGIAAAWLAGVVFAPVELIQVGEDYFVRDGHHRISIARAMGQRFIDAEVTIWEVRRQPVEAQLPLKADEPSTDCQPAFAF